MRPANPTQTRAAWHRAQRDADRARAAAEHATRAASDVARLIVLALVVAASTLLALHLM